jgi:hypothetical protein
MSENTSPKTETTETAPKLPPITPYAAAQITNRVLKAKGVDKEITPQMMYSYAKKNSIQTVTVAGSKKVHFDGDAFKTWLTAYVNGGSVTTGRADYDKLAKQFA